MIEDREKNSKLIQYLQKKFENIQTLLPASISALLLYGIIFGFIIAAYASIPWQKSYTISYYFVVVFLGLISLIRLRFRVSITRVDLLFVVFFFLVMFSTMMNWWQGSMHNLWLSAIFFILPYALGSIIDDEQLLKFMSWLFAMGLMLLIILPFENFRMFLPYGNWPSPYIFGQPHGVMLAGLLLSATFTVIIFRLLLPTTETVAGGGGGDDNSIITILLFGLIIIAVAWLQARGSAIVGIIAAIIMLTFSPYCGVKKKITIVLAFLIFFIAAINNPFKNEYSNEFYSAIFQPPKVFLNSSTLNEYQGSRDFIEWSPILGADACKTIKDSISDRWIHYQTAIAIFVKHPIVGVGANHYGDYACTKPGSFPHSTILQVLSELGLVGGAIYLALLLVAYNTIYKRYNYSSDIKVKAIAAWLLAFLTLQLATSQLYGNYYFSAGLYFVLGIASRIANEEVRVLTGRL